VTGALECPSTEKRMIISLDTSQMVSDCDPMHVMAAVEYIPSIHWNL